MWGRSFLQSDKADLADHSEVGMKIRIYGVGGWDWEFVLCWLNPMPFYDGFWGARSLVKISSWLDLQPTSA